jgi:hypothetical protein
MDLVLVPRLQPGNVGFPGSAWGRRFARVRRRSRPGAALPGWSLGARIIQLAALLGCFLLSVEILSALGVGVFLRLLAALSILVLPWVNIVICLGIAGLAARALKRIGLPVGLTGVSDEVVSQLLSGLRCLSCGYSLIGNVSGVCPECGCATRCQKTLQSSEKAVPDRSSSSTEGI